MASKLTSLSAPKSLSSPSSLFLLRHLLLNLSPAQPLSLNFSFTLTQSLQLPTRLLPAMWGSPSSGEIGRDLRGRVTGSCLCPQSVQLSGMQSLCFWSVCMCVFVCRAFFFFSTYWVYVYIAFFPGDESYFPLICSFVYSTNIYESLPHWALWLIVVIQVWKPTSGSF